MGQNTAKLVLRLSPIILTVLVLAIGMITGKVGWMGAPEPTTTFAVSSAAVPPEVPEQVRAQLTRGLTVTGLLGNPLLLSPHGWLQKNIQHPMIIKDQGKYHMYFEAGPGLVNYRIGHAESMSLRGLWTIDESPVLDVSPDRWDKAYLASPYVMKVGDTFYMWYSAYDGNQVRIGVAGAAKPQGPFRKLSQNPFDHGQERSQAVVGWVGSVQRVAGEYLMWFGQDGQVNLGMSPSPEGPWRLVTRSLLRSGGPGSWKEYGFSAEGGVVHQNGVFTGFFVGMTKSAPGEAKPQPSIGMAMSLDGAQWYESPANPIVTAGREATYNSEGFLDCSVYYEDGTYYVIFAGASPGEGGALSQAVSLVKVRLQ